VELYNQKQENGHLSIERLISGLAVRRKVCQLIHQGHLTDQVMSALNDMAS
jgi:hypothetical protein